jgi:hypothetical protein
MLRLPVPLLSATGLSADGQVGDADPLRAIADALTGFPADELVIATHPRELSNWLELGLIERARAFGLPIVHVMVSPAHGRHLAILA